MVSIAGKLIAKYKLFELRSDDFDPEEGIGYDDDYGDGDEFPSPERQKEWDRLDKEYEKEYNAARTLITIKKQTASGINTYYYVVVAGSIAASLSQLNSGPPKLDPRMADVGSKIAGGVGAGAGYLAMQHPKAQAGLHKASKFISQKTGISPEFARKGVDFVAPALVAGAGNIIGTAAGKSAYKFISMFRYKHEFKALMGRADLIIDNMQKLMRRKGEDPRSVSSEQIKALVKLFRSNYSNVSLFVDKYERLF